MSYMWGNKYTNDEGKKKQPAQHLAFIDTQTLALIDSTNFSRPFKNIAEVKKYKNNVSFLQFSS